MLRMENTLTNTMYSINAMRAALDKSFHQMHKCKQTTLTSKCPTWKFENGNADFRWNINICIFLYLFIEALSFSTAR